MIRARPILFSAPMVCALLAGTKTQTRRIIKPGKGEELDPEGIYTYHPGDHELARCPYGQRCDLLWVKETFKDMICDPYETIYRADGERPPGFNEGWQSSVYMPRAASRLTLEITDVRIQLLQNITEADAAAEGYASDGDEAARIWYSRLWDEINGNGAWDKNPWIYVLTFKVHKRNVDAFLEEKQA